MGGAASIPREGDGIPRAALPLWIPAFAGMTSGGRPFDKLRVNGIAKRPYGNAVRPVFAWRSFREHSPLPFPSGFLPSQE